MPFRYDAHEQKLRLADRLSHTDAGSALPLVRNDWMKIVGKVLETGPIIAETPSGIKSNPDAAKDLAERLTGAFNVLGNVLPSGRIPAATCGSIALEVVRTGPIVTDRKAVDAILAETRPLAARVSDRMALSV